VRGGRQEEEQWEQEFGRADQPIMRVSALRHRTGDTG
jgi:hypothetical protein